MTGEERRGERVEEKGMRAVDGAILMGLLFTHHIKVDLLHSGVLNNNCSYNTSGPM